MKYNLISVCLLAMWFFCACNDDFEYSVYAEHVDDEKQETTAKNIEKLDEKNTKEFSEFSIFLLSDTHIYYKELRKACKKINSMKKDADFVIHCGDISNEGLFKEFEFTWNLMNEVKLPYLTVIGNHDLVANGRAIYKKMFGKENYTYVYKNCKFVFFDDNIWENTVKDPDFEWLEQELNDTSEPYTHIILISHVPYWDEMYFKTQQRAFKSVIENSNTRLSIHGHLHIPDLKQDTLLDNSIVRYLITGSVRYHTIRRLDIKQDTIIINDITF